MLAFVQEFAKIVRDLSIIIVSWNVAELLDVCLKSIFNNTQSSDMLDMEVIVVDSASEDGTVQMLRDHYPQVNVLPQAQNLGFSRCNNIGLKAATGRHILLLNPDTEIITDALGKMVAYLDVHHDVGIIGPHTLNSDGSTQSTRRRFPTRTLAFFESTWLQSFAPCRLLDNYYVRDVGDNAIADVDWVQGSALMTRREVYRQIGELDEAYVMFSEEMDWCKRAKDAGWRVVYFGQAQIVHHGGKSTEQVVARRHIHFQQSKLRYFKKYHGRWFAQMLRIFLLALYVLQLGLEAGKSLLGHKRALRQERIKAYWQVLRSGLKVS
ncbi:MAG: glycosyltransferase family 2 protein [Chloroflexi bacterium]|nr:MAG: glycosyltransferase family 2 protein [Phototrophicales bacterium]RMF81976.1 MAG: glycosyltransferase family 2 protein [Chloroflexota bacterium]